MRSKINLKNIFLLIFPPSWAVLLPSSRAGGWEWGSQSVHPTWSLLLLGERTWSPSPAPVGSLPSLHTLAHLGPPQGHKCFQQTCSSMDSSPQVPAPAQASHIVTAFFGHGPAPPGAAGASLHPCGVPWPSPWFSFPGGDRGISALVPGAAPAPSPALPWVSADLLLSHLLTLLFSRPSYSCTRLFLLKSMILMCPYHLC